MEADQHANFCHKRNDDIEILGDLAAPHHLRWVEKNLYGIGRGPLLGVSRPRLLGEVTCWKPSVSLPIKVFRADAGPMSHSKECLPVGRRGISVAPVLETAAQLYPLRMLTSRFCDLLCAGGGVVPPPIVLTLMNKFVSRILERKPTRRQFDNEARFF